MNNLLIWIFYNINLTYNIDKELIIWNRDMHTAQNVRIQSYSGPNSVQMRENTDQNNSENGHFLHGAQHCRVFS